MSSSASPSVQLFTITEHTEGQRLDNFLVKVCKGIPKTHLYKRIRAGEVRVNKKRSSVDYRLQCGDVVRLPPMRMAEAVDRKVPIKAAAHLPVLFEDDFFMVVQKPEGLAVHGGSGVEFGLIEQLRAFRSVQEGKEVFLELVHRLDRDTSGMLLIAKTRKALVSMHDQMRQGVWRKEYMAIVHGSVQQAHQHIRFPLKRWLTPSGERRVSVDSEGQYAHTEAWNVFSRANFSLLRILLKTGRTHQIRVHLQHMHHPIVGDDKYGLEVLDKEIARTREVRLFLHAYYLKGVHPITHEPLSFQLRVPATFLKFLECTPQEEVVLTHLFDRNALYVSL